MKTIAFFLRNIDADKLPFSARNLYYHSYQEYLLAMKRAGSHAYFVTNDATYLGKGCFSQAWDIDRVSEVKDFKTIGEIRADLVFDKGGFEGIDVKVVTDPRLHSLLDDKSLMFKYFGKYQPQTVLCDDAAAVKAAIQAMPGDMIVVKNPHGCGGKRVYIGKKNSVQVPPEETYPLLVQEFVDMSDGIPGIADGVHDMRILFAGNTIIGATLRQPAPGSLYANVSKGAIERLLPYNKIPPEVRALALDIGSQIDDLPRYYAIDFARGKHGWKLIELNNKPGLFRENTGPLAREFMESLAGYLVKL